MKYIRDLERMNTEDNERYNHQLNLQENLSNINIIKGYKEDNQQTKDIY